MVVRFCVLVSRIIKKKDEDDSCSGMMSKRKWRRRKVAKVSMEREQRELGEP